MNSIKTAMLMALLTALLVVVGGSLGGNDGMMIMLVFSLAMNFFTYWNSDSVVLKMYGAREVDRGQARDLHEIVERLSQKAGIPKPKIYVVNSETPNAFATGRNPSHAAVAVTTGLMRMLDYDEITGVLAHELSHIKNRDTLISTVAASFAGIISTIGHMAQWAAIFGGMGGRNRDNDGGGLGAIFLIVIAPLAAALIQMAISRSREFAADHSAGEISGKPLDLASALLKLESAAARMRTIPGAGTATAHLFIVNPLKNANLSLKSLFSTHPSTEERVAALRQQASEMGQY